MADLIFVRVSSGELTMNRLGTQGCEKKISRQLQKLTGQLARLSRAENYSVIAREITLDKDVGLDRARPALIRRGMIHSDDALTVRAIRGCAPGAIRERQELQRHYFALPHSAKLDGGLSPKQLNVLFDRFTCLVPKYIAATIDFQRQKAENVGTDYYLAIGRELCSVMVRAGFKRVHLTALPLPIENLRQLMTFGLQLLAAGTIGFGVKKEFLFPPIGLTSGSLGPSPAMTIERQGEQADIVIYKNSAGHSPATSP